VEGLCSGMKQQYGLKFNTCWKCDLA